MVGLIPLYAVQIMEPELLDAMPGFKMRLEWFIENRKDLTEQHGLHGNRRAQASAGCFPLQAVSSFSAF